MHIKVSVKAGALKESLVPRLDGGFDISVTEKRKGGAANRRVGGLLQAHFGRGVSVRLVSGARSSSKIFSIERR